MGLHDVRLVELEEGYGARRVVLNATDPNLDAFKAHGAKLMLWHGWSDPALTPLGHIRYYESVQARDARPAITSECS